MPCRKVNHKHEWPSTGVLTIFPCETICSICDSMKEYKPASALRKHVQTHIKKDRLLLSLQRGASGRPKRETAIIQSPTAGCHACFDTTATLSKDLQESRRASSDGPALLPTTAASSIAFTSMLDPAASELDAPLDVPGVESVEEMRIWTTFRETTHNHMDTSPDTSTLSCLPPSPRASDLSHSHQMEQLSESLARFRLST